MGSISSSAWRTKQDMVDYLQRSDRFISGCVIKKSSVVGNHHWYLIEYEGRTTIELDVMSVFKRKGRSSNAEWGYSNMSEEHGPCEKDCPISFLKLASEPQSYAIEWRKEVLAHHDRKNKKAFVDMVVSFGGKQYQLLANLGRKGWRVLEIESNAIYRMNCRLLNKALMQTSNKF